MINKAHECLSLLQKQSETTFVDVCLLLFKTDPTLEGLCQPFQTESVFERKDFASKEDTPRKETNMIKLLAIQLKLPHANKL